MLITLSMVTLFFSVVSQSIMDLFGTIFILYAGFLVFKKKESPFLDQKLDYKKVLTSKYFIFFYFWVLWVLLSFLFGATTYERLVGRILEFRWVTYLFCFFFLVAKIQTKQLQFFLFSLAGMCFLSLHIYVADKNYITGLPFTTEVVRAGGFLNDPMTLAHGLGLFVAFLFGYFSRLKLVFLKANLLSFFLILATILMTMTRGVWIAVIATFAIYFLIQSWRQFVLFLVAVLILAGVGYSFSANIKSRIDQAIHYKTSYDTERTVLWKTNWHIFKTNPVFGIGYGENKHRLREFYDQLQIPAGQFEGHAHNQYLNFISGTGAIGLLFYLIWLGMNIYWAYALSRNQKVSIQMQALGFGSFLAQLVLVVGGLTEANFEHSKIKTIIAFLWAISFYGYYFRESLYAKAHPRSTS